MQILELPEVCRQYCKIKGKPGIWFNIYDKDGLLPWEVEEEEYEFSSELEKAAPWLSVKDYGQIMIDGYGFILCQDREEQMNIYWQTVGDDGPTDSNPYKGPVRVYALTINSYGEFEYENT